LPDSPERTVRRWLDPVDRFSEALFGLIMILTFTSSVSAAQGGREEIREILVGAICCNLAWGLVDAVMYVLARSSERTRETALLREFRSAADPARAREILLRALPEAVREAIRPDHLEELRAGLVARPERPRRRLEPADWLAAVAVFCWVNLIAVPVIVPFVVMQEAIPALRVSNGVAIVMLFVGGFLLARASGGRPVRTGLWMVVVGLVLVAITVALGG
jgi:VIT1/CCC1 family predicted Fe2+/Mn2+ transporter